MTPSEIKILRDACLVAGVNASQISAENPFTKKGKTAELIQMAVAEFHPEQAARWRKDAGGTISLETAAVLAGEAEPSDATRADLWAHDPQYVRDAIKEREQSEAALLKHLEESATAAYRKRVGERAFEAEQQQAAAAERQRQHDIAMGRK